jgi:hypothetical protein
MVKEERVKDKGLEVLKVSLVKDKVMVKEERVKDKGLEVAKVNLMTSKSSRIQRTL